MRKLLVGLVLGGVAVGCGSSGASGPGPAAAAPSADASSYSRDGFSISRLDGWTFVPPDASVAQDTLVILQGPTGKEILAPAVEVSRRALSAADQRRKASHVLTQLVTEMVQMFDGFEMQGQPEDLEIAGKPGARLRLKYSESLPDGGTAPRGGQFFGIVNGGSLWIIRCVGPQDGSADGQFQKIVDSISISG